jgi:hypothetical protein
MKRTILFIMLCIATLAVSAQKLTATDWSYSYVGVAADTIGAVATTWSKTIDVSAPEQKAVAIQLKLTDKVAGGAATVALQGRVFATDAYSTISTITWTGIGSTDSTITINSGTTLYNYNYYKVLVTRTANKATINSLKLVVKK